MSVTGKIIRRMVRRRTSHSEPILLNRAPSRSMSAIPQSRFGSGRMSQVNPCSFAAPWLVAQSARSVEPHQTLGEPMEKSMLSERRGAAPAGKSALRESVSLCSARTATPPERRRRSAPRKVSEEGDFTPPDPKPMAPLGVCFSGWTEGCTPMFRGKVIQPSLLGLALILSFVSSAEARKWRFNFFGLQVYGYSSRSVVYGHFPRSAVDRRNVANVVETARASTGGGAVGALLVRLVRGCLQQAAEFQNWPFEAITEIASPDDAQRSALEALRASTSAAAERLSADCPRDEPAPSGGRLEAAEQAIDTVTSSFTAVEPPLRAFFARSTMNRKRGFCATCRRPVSRRWKVIARKRAGSAAAAGVLFQPPPAAGTSACGLEFAKISSRRCVDGRSARSNAACASQRRNVWLSTNSFLDDQANACLPCGDAGASVRGLGPAMSGGGCAASAIGAISSISKSRACHHAIACPWLIRLGVQVGIHVGDVLCPPEV